MPRGLRAWHPFTDFTQHKHNEWEMVCKCRDFLEDTSLHAGNCKCLINRRTLKCNCLKILEDSVARDAIALYMVAFFNKLKVDQQLTIMDWLRYTSADTKRMFFVPFLNPYDEEELDLVDEDTPHKHAVLAALAGTRVCKYAVTTAVRDFVLLDPVAPTGIKEIKQIELFTKWRKLVPAEFADIISPYPGDEVMRKFKEERNRKAREQTQRKRDTSSSHPTTKQKTQ
eukprot:jgi/Psemu1/41184/gm1.41184_g